MHFTVHLRSEETYQDDFSYGLVFIPCPVWVKGKEQILNLNPERPDYCKGGIARLIAHEKLSGVLQGKRIAIVLIHPIGHGSMKDLATLQEDLLGEGFDVSVHGNLELKGPFITDPA
jgi:hypothetical protein